MSCYSSKPSYGFTPVIKWNIMHPKAQTSVVRLIWSSHCSGLLKCGVPAPLTFWSEFYDPSNFIEKPRSIILAEFWSSVRTMLCGFKSRWIIFLEYKKASALIICRPNILAFSISSASDNFYRLWFIKWLRSLPPRCSSIRCVMYLPLLLCWASSNL